MVAIELFPNSEIQVYKDAQTRKLNITAFNHFSEAEVKYQVTDDTLKIFLVVLSIVLTGAITVFLLMYCVKKIKGGAKKTTTFDEIDRLIYKEEAVRMSSSVDLNSIQDIQKSRENGLTDESDYFGHTKKRYSQEKDDMDKIELKPLH